MGRFYAFIACIVLIAINMLTLNNNYISYALLIYPIFLLIVMSYHGLRNFFGYEDKDE